MISQRFSSSVTRRRALAGVAGGGMALAAAARLGATQGATPVDGGSHPIVGVWMLDTESDLSDNVPEMTVITSDGAYISLDGDGAVTIGVWVATGESTADVTIRGANADEQGAYAGLFVIRASVEVDASGDTFTAPYTFELVDADGTGSGQYGPGTAMATRLVAEPMGEPVGPLEEFFGQFGEGEEASPAAGMASEMIHLGLGEYFITADRVTLDVGTPYSFMATNSGQMVHEVVIEPAGTVDKPLEHDDMVAEMEDIAPGATAELTWTFEEAGAYQFGCHIEGHYEEGMVLAFEVVG